MKKGMTVINQKPSLQYFINNLTLKSYIQIVETKYIFSPTFNEIVINEMEGFIRDYWEGKNPKLILSASVQTGKSLLNSLFISYIAVLSQLVNIEDEMIDGFRIVIASYSSHIAKQRVKSIKGYIKDFTYQFNQVSKKYGWNKQLPTKYQIDKTDEIQLNKHFYIRSCGIGGSLTGFSADLLIVDDFCKDYASALSNKIRENTEDWWSSVADSRKQSKYGQFIFSTSWHSKDLINYLMANYDFRRINFPAIYTDENGEEKSICPEIKSLEFFQNVRKVTPVHIWSALYLGDATSVKGTVFTEDIFKSNKFSLDKVIDLNIGLTKTDRCWIVCDTSLKGGERNDYSVFTLFYSNSKDKVYVLDVMRLKVDGSELINHFTRFYNNWTNKLKRSSIMTLIEDKASGTQLIQDLKKNLKLHIIPIIPNKDKVTRVLEVSHLFGKLMINETVYSNLVKELLEFSYSLNHAHDDQVDTIAYGLNFWNDPNVFNKKR